MATQNDNAVPKFEAKASTNTADAARADAQQTAYRIRALVAAAFACNDGADPQVEAILDVAKEKLAALVESLDSVNWPPTGAA